MARIFSAPLVAAVVFAVAPLALHAQQDSTVVGQANVVIEQAQNDPQWQATLQTPGEAADPGVSSQWETSMPAPPDITVINIKAPPKAESKSDKDKGKLAAQAKKKLIPAPAKAKSAPVGTPGGKEQQSQQSWETEFLVDHVQDHQVDRATPKT